jgi:hypothetical protein
MSIERGPSKDKTWICFEDWDADMMVLSSNLHAKPDPPDKVVPRNHELGIDKLSKLANGKKAIDVMYDLVDDLPYRIDAQGVLNMGLLVMKTDAALAQFLAKDKCERSHPSSHAAEKPEWRPEWRRKQKRTTRRYRSPNREPDVPRTLEQTKRQLREWDVYGHMLLGPDHGLPRRVVRAKYNHFVMTFYGRRNVLGQVILDYPGKARYWALEFLSNPRFDIQDAIDPRVKTKTEKFGFTRGN